MEKALFDDMLDKGLVLEGSMFAGHSLGEYSALAAMANMLPLEQLLSIVFYRGLSMQVAVDRDVNGRSNYAMAAVNTSRISKGKNPSTKLFTPSTTFTDEAQHSASSIS